MKIVGDPEYGEILGAHIVGNIACDMISEICNVMALEGGYPELQRIIHPHPTMSEAILDGARAVDGWAIHARVDEEAGSKRSATGYSRSRSRCWCSISQCRRASHLWHDLKDEWPSFAAFFVSFWVIGIIWVNHHGVVDHLKRVDRGVLYLNLLVLMTVVFIPSRPP